MKEKKKIEIKIIKPSKNLIKSRLQIVPSNKTSTSSSSNKKIITNNLFTYYTGKNNEKKMNQNKINVKKNFGNNIKAKNKNKKYISPISSDVHKMLIKTDLDIKYPLKEESKKQINLIFDETKLNHISDRISSKSFEHIIAYAANTNKGILKYYNEDRISIVVNMNQPNDYQSKDKFPKVSYFAIFDGHGGFKSAEYLRDNLLNLICTNKNFPNNINLAIKESFKKADETFLNEHAFSDGKLKDRSGSCGLFLLVINDTIYVANVGDSRCLVSYNNEKKRKAVTRDHRPNFAYEKERIIKNGGIIYQTKNILNIENNNTLYKGKILKGPFRVFPGRLSVSRTIGDAEAKLKNFGGLENVVINEPDVYSYNIEENDIDYFILGCDGIFEQLKNEDIFQCVSMVVKHNKELLEKSNKKNLNINNHKICGEIVNLILKAAMERKSLDNLTCIFIAFKDLLNISKDKDISIISPNTYRKTLSPPKSLRRFNINGIEINLNEKHKNNIFNSFRKEKYSTTNFKNQKKIQNTIASTSRFTKKITLFQNSYINNNNKNFSLKKELTKFKKYKTKNIFELPKKESSKVKINKSVNNNNVTNYDSISSKGRVIRQNRGKRNTYKGNNTKLAISLSKNDLIKAQEKEKTQKINQEKCITLNQDNVQKYNKRIKKIKLINIISKSPQNIKLNTQFLLNSRKNNNKMNVRTAFIDLDII